MRRVLHGDDEEEQPEVPELTSREARERGVSFEELRQQVIVPTPRPYRAGAYERRLAMFVAARIEEAQIVENMHLLPDNLPINRQPWWKTKVWQALWAGESDAMRQRSR